MADKESFLINWFVKPFVVSLAVGSVILLCQILWDLGSDVNKNIQMLSKISTYNSDQVQSMQESYHKEFAKMFSQIELLNKELIKLNAQLNRKESIYAPIDEKKPLIIIPKTFSLPKISDSAINKYNKKLDKDLKNKIEQRMMQREQLQQIQLK